MPLLALLVPALVQVLTKPWIYVLVISWFVVSRFNIGIFATEARDTILSLWPLLIIFLVFLLLREVVRLKLGNRGRDK